MADGRDEAHPNERGYLWAGIFRCFQFALDPRKLAVAALGILVMSVGWYLLSAIFYYPEPTRDSDAYSNTTVNSYFEKKNLAEAEIKAEGDRWYQRDLEQWRVLADLAAPSKSDANGTIPGGRLRTLPWDEYRGPNPYLLIGTLFSGNPEERGEAGRQFLSATLPVLVEPLAKLFLPLVRFIDPNTSPMTRVYLLLCLIWSLACWAFFGGIITRIAAVQLTGKDRISIQEAVKFVVDRYLSYLFAPLVPLAITALVVLGLMLYGFLALIPFVGDVVLYGLLLPLIFIGGLVMAIMLVGLVSYPLMYATISTEGSDTFDGLSRSYNYVFQAPWAYAWYSVLAVVYGAVVTLLVVFIASLTVYLAKWGVSQAPLSEYFSRKPDYLFVHAPRSFGWQELLLKGSPLEQQETVVKNESGRPRSAYSDKNPQAAQTYRKSITAIERIGAVLASFWLVLAFLLMLGFSYSYFWTASTQIYLLMRKRCDDLELDEIYLEEELPEAPYSPPPVKTDAPLPTSVASLPTVPPPAEPAKTIPFPSAPGNAATAAVERSTEATPTATTPPVTTASTPPAVTPPEAVKAEPPKTPESPSSATEKPDAPQTPDNPERK